MTQKAHCFVRGHCQLGSGLFLIGERKIAFNCYNSFRDRNAIYKRGY